MARIQHKTNRDLKFCMIAYNKSAQEVRAYYRFIKVKRRNSSRLTEFISDVERSYSTSILKRKSALNASKKCANLRSNEHDSRFARGSAVAAELALQQGTQLKNLDVGTIDISFLGDEWYRAGFMHVLCSAVVRASREDDGTKKYFFKRTADAPNCASSATDNFPFLESADLRDKILRLVSRAWDKPLLSLSGRLRPRSVGQALTESHKIAFKDSGYYVSYMQKGTKAERFTQVVISSFKLLNKLIRTCVAGRAAVSRQRARNKNVSLHTVFRWHFACCCVFSPEMP